MRVLNEVETGCVAGGLAQARTAAAISRSLASPAAAPGFGGGYQANGTMMDIYNAVKYARWTPSEIQMDLYTSPGATITYTEAGVAAGDIVWAAGALSATIGYEIGTVAYDHMDVQTQDAIGGTIDAALYNMTEAWDLFLQEY
ncbi:hypothetical protein J4H89_23345 (plasmid) [Ralstonia solanacearum]|nr:hypothetical protein J4H89_23345 [Ralstonia solanacearum]